MANAITLVIVPATTSVTLKRYVKRKGPYVLYYKDFPFGPESGMIVSGVRIEYSSASLRRPRRQHGGHDDRKLAAPSRTPPSSFTRLGLNAIAAVHLKIDEGGRLVCWRLRFLSSRLFTTYFICTHCGIYRISPFWVDGVGGLFVG